MFPKPTTIAMSIARSLEANVQLLRLNLGCRGYRTNAESGPQS
jgi:hypothetical protein